MFFLCMWRNLPQSRSAYSTENMWQKEILLKSAETVLILDLFPVICASWDNPIEKGTKL